jgi:hypothetical protein
VKVNLPLACSSVARNLPTHRAYRPAAVNLWKWLFGNRLCLPWLPLSKAWHGRLRLAGRACMRRAGSHDSAIIQTVPAGLSRSPGLIEHKMFPGGFGLVHQVISHGDELFNVFRRRIGCRNSAAK